MPQWHGYLAAQRVQLTNDQAQTLWTQLQQLQPAGSPRHPAQRNHHRFSLDQSKVIFEALFDTDTLTTNAIKARLAAIFAIGPSDITHATQQVTYHALPSVIVSYSYAGDTRFRLAALGTFAATWPQSREEALALIAANPEEWEEGQS